MRNLVLIHLESLNSMNYRINREFFQTLYRWEREALSFTNYYATASSTLMVASDLAFGGIIQNEPSRRLTDKLEKYCYENSFLDVLKEKGYRIGAYSYPPDGMGDTGDTEGVNHKNFIGYTVRMEEKDSYDKYLSAIDETMTKDKPFAVWACNYVSNVSYNRYMPTKESQTSLERWEHSYRYMDRCVDEILCMVERKGLLNNTTILVYGDHGDDFYTHGKHKGLAHAIEPYAELIHTPLWIYDARFQEGACINRLINTTDIRDIVEQLLSLPDRELSVGELGLPERQYSFARNVYAAQMLKAGSFNKGYCLTDGKFMLMAGNTGMQLFQIEMDPTCHHNLLDYFILEEDEPVLNERMYKDLKYHFKSVIDEGALSQIKHVFSSFRKHLREEVFRLYQYAECEECFSEIDFHKINYGQAESQNNACSEQNLAGVMAKIMNRLLNCMQTDQLAVYGKAVEEPEGLYSTVKIRHIVNLKEISQYPTSYIACEDYDELGEVLPYIEQSRDKITVAVYVKKTEANPEQMKEMREIPCRYIGVPMPEGKLYLFGKIFEYSDNIVVPDDFKVLAVMHVYNDVDILEMNIQYLLSQEIDIYLVDHWSEDGSYEIANKYREQYPSHIFSEHFPNNRKSDCYDLYHQLERTEQITRETDYQWYIHYDADEMMVSPWENRNLREAIYYVDELGFNAIENTALSTDFCRRKTWKKGKSIDLKDTGGNIARIEEPKIFPLTILSRHFDAAEIEAVSANYVSLFMGCGTQMEEDRGSFDVYTEYFSGKKVVLYGAGKYGVYCCEELSKKAEIVAWVDRDFAYMPWICCKNISAPDCIRGLEFDAVFIAIQNNKIWQEVKDMLIAMGIPSRKIY